MSRDVCILGSPFALRAGASADDVRGVVQECMDDYQLDFEPDVDGKYCLDHADSFEAGVSIGGRLAKLVGALRPFAADAFVLTLRELDTGNDERDSAFFGGPDDQSILAFRQQRAISDALEVLRGVPGLDEQIAALRTSAPDTPLPTGDKSPAQTPLDSTAFGAVMGAAYDFRDAHLSGSKNLQQTAHAELEAAVRDALGTASSDLDEGDLTDAEKTNERPAP